MIDLNFPPFEHKIINSEGKLYIFDILRKKYVFLTPEEWVRQHLVHFLISGKGYPKSLMKIEGGMKYNKMQKRTDLLIYDYNGNPFMLVECKGANILLSGDVLEQIAQYNHTIKAPNMLITNGINHFYCQINLVDRQLDWTEEIPEWKTG